MEVAYEIRPDTILETIDEMPNLVIGHREAKRSGIELRNMKSEADATNTESTVRLNDAEEKETTRKNSLESREGEK